MSPTLKRIRWRLVWSSLAAFVLALGAFGLNQWVYSYSDDECLWKVEGTKVTIQEIVPNGMAEEAGLLEGDELVAIQGRKVTPRTLNVAQRMINEQAEGRVLLYTVRREGKLLYLPVRLIKPFDFVGLSALIAGFVSWAIGLLVVISSPQRKVARHFFYLGLLALLSSVYTRTNFGNIPLSVLVPTIALAGLVLSVIPPLWLHFFLRFPHPFPLRTNRKFLVWLYGGFMTVGLVSTLVGIVGALAGGGGPLGELFSGELLKLTATLRPLLGILGSCIPLTILAGLVVFWMGTFKLPERRRRALLPALIFGTAIFADLAAYSYLRQRSGQSLMFQRDAWIFFAPLPLLPLSFAYAIFRHGFFDVRRALLRWLTYFLVLGLTLGAYLGALAWIFAEGIQVIPATWMGVLMGLSALPIGWLLRWLLLALRKKFRRDLSTARDLILGNLRETKKRFSEEALLHGLAVSLREAFRPQVMLMLPVADRIVQLPPAEDTEPDDPFAQSLAATLAMRLPASLVRHARENGELVIGLGGDEAEWIREQGEVVRAHVDALEAQVMVLLMAGDEPHTVLMLGGKYAELNYGRDDRDLLREVAMAAGVLLETAVLHRRLLDQGRIEQELQTARRIQESLITFEAPSIPGYSLALRLEPALETGGDLLWVKRRSHGKWIAAVGDVSGKGLAAALYMSQATALLKFATQQEGMDFDRLLPALDQTMRNLMGSKDFLTLCLLEWDERGHYRVARAGHPSPLLIKGPRPEDAVELASQGRGLGLRPDMPCSWMVYEGDLAPGEWIVMYSDGLTEAMNKPGELYGFTRFRDQLQHFWAMGSVRAACEAVYRDVASFECQNRDDRTLFILGRENA